MASFLKVDQIQSDSGNVALTGNVTTQSTAVVNFGDGQFIKDAAGNIGIGTSSPARRLDVRGGLGMQVNEDGAGTKVISLRSDFAGVGPAVNVTTNDPLLLMTNNTEQARITSAGLLQFNSGYGSVATAFGCRAWVNFDGLTGNGNTIRGSGNVSSITDNGTGDYTVNFTTAMPDTNYSFVGICVEDPGGAFGSFGAGHDVQEFANNPTRVTTSARFRTRVPSTGLRDAGNISIQIFR